MVDLAKANTIQPSNSTEHILVDRRIGKEVDHRVRDDAENADSTSCLKASTALFAVRNRMWTRDPELARAPR